jgi:hypothetical protein
MAIYAHCTAVALDCPVSATTIGYTPSLPANAVLLSIFGFVGIVNLMHGIDWKTYVFTTAVALGSLCEVMGKGVRLKMYFKQTLMMEKGYSGRLMLHSNS